MRRVTATENQSKLEVIVLSDGERNLLRLVRETHSYKEIASQLHLREGDVRNRLSKLAKGLNVNGSRGLIAFAYQYPEAAESGRVVRRNGV